MSQNAQLLARARHERQILTPDTNCGRGASTIFFQCLNALYDHVRFHPDLLKKFGGAKFITSIREPYSHATSVFTFFEKDQPFVRFGGSIEKFYKNKEVWVEKLKFSKLPNKIQLNLVIFEGIFNEILAQKSVSEFMGRNLAILGHFL